MDSEYQKLKYLQKLIILILNLLFEMGTFICITIIVSASSDDSFESHTIVNLENYFFEVTKHSNFNINNNNKYNKQNTLNNFSFLNKNNKKLNFRRLVSESFCLEMLEKFKIFKGSKLSNIFDLKYDKIKTYSSVILGIQCAIGLIEIVVIFYCCKEGIEKFRNRRMFKYLITILFPLLMVSKYVCILILLYYFEKGDIETYDDFLDCKNVRVDFFDQFSDVDKIRKCFYVFLILNIAIQGIDRFEKILDFINDMRKPETQNK